MSGRRILAVDPGTFDSGWCVYHEGHVVASGVSTNEDLRDMLGSNGTMPWHFTDVLAIEMIASYGMPVGSETFETCVWIGRFDEAWRKRRGFKALLVLRREVKSHLCGSMKAKDGNIRQALLDKLGPQGTKKAPGPTYGVRTHAWAAVGVAVTVDETR